MNTSTNTITGGNVGGPVVQARSIHGGVHIHPGPAQRWQRPAQLPRPATVFVDRTTEQARVAATLDAGRIAVLVGPDGIGRTALAARVLRAQDEPGGYLAADLRPAPGRRPVALNVLGGFLRALGAPLVPGGLVEAQGLWRTLSAARRPAVLLAGASDEDLVADLLPAADCRTVVTAPAHLDRLVPHGAVHLDLGPLPVHDAAELLTALAYRPLDNGDRTGLDRLVAACAGLPLAIGLAAAQLQIDPDLTPAHLADTLAGPVPDRRSHPVEATVTRALDQAYGRLDDTRAAAYRALGALPAVPVDAALLAAATATSPAAATAHLTALRRRHLVTVTDEGPDGPRYRLPGPGHDHAARLAASTDGPDASAATVLGAVRWWVAAAEAAGALASARRPLLPPQPGHDGTAFPGPDAARTWLEAQDPLVRPLVAATARTGHHALVWRAALALWPLILRHRDYPLWLWLYQLALDAVREDTDAPPAALRQTLNSLAIGLRAVGLHDEALELLHQALASADTDPSDGVALPRAQHLHDIGATLHDAGRAAQARGPLEEALRLRRELGYARGVALTEIVLAGAVADLGEVRSGLAMLRRARAALAGEPLEAMRALAWTGHLLTAAGHPLLAWRVLGASQDAAEALGHALWSARLREWRALAAEAAGRPAVARRLFSASHQAYTAAASASDVGRLTRHLERLTNPAGPPPT
ncbi:tetratricopeptide repeat protein [Streptomyces sp. BE20]|uniref:tetratricopeptide repeat protein n=1 Tax=Streptomyces sp. BE20 TaxID=3002525 RepID=UPI002E785DA0|nr:tetratricopeptide repeat protein [Streptomyces sp. BE20]MEE1820989.1 tetratricopeptide repeat protein [Streptomyces sp. BE20]